jgi:hypothetical protein
MRFLVLLFSFVFLSCKSTYKVADRKDVLLDSVSIRAIMPMNGGVWFGGTNSKAGFISFDNDSDSKIIKLQKENADFRSIGADGSIYFLNAGTPANMYKMSLFRPDFVPNLVYTEQGDKVFYDSMHISGELGAIVGDPTENCLSILIKRKYNDKWHKIPCDSLPKTVDGEAAFAASDTNVKIYGDVIFIISGGKKSRLFKSIDKGKTWEVFETPIIQGEAMTGAFSMDFFNAKKGIIVGGNYDNQKDNSANKAITKDGGKTWKLVSENKSFGYASCVQYAPNQNGKIVFCCGPSGVYSSKNGGKNWTKFLDDTDYYTMRFSSKNTLILAGKNKVTKIKISH